jgi:hypothetical protein
MFEKKTLVRHLFWPKRRWMRDPAVFTSFLANNGSRYALSLTDHRNGFRKLVLIVAWIDCTGQLCSAT